MILLPELHRNVTELTHDMGSIPAERKQLLEKLADYIRSKRALKESVNLVFVCTHNSRRSHIAQIWAQAAAAHFQIADVNCFSGGTEVTAFNPNAIEAMRKIGFEIEQTDDSSNPNYTVRYSAELPAISAWSKRFDDKENPDADFSAIMTCSDADENCPFIEGANMRIGITYQDPKLSDGTDAQNAVYLERARQIGQEMLYVFSKV